MTTWRDALEPYNEGLVPHLFDEAFLKDWGPQPWQPSSEDRRAAAFLHNQLISRISLQPLAYSEGTERAALISVFQLFQKTRDLVEANYRCALFECLAWHVLNAHVRPFTAKWHRESEAGTLEALDMTDEFRHELDQLRPRLAAFANLLLEIRDGAKPPVKWHAKKRNEARSSTIADELAMPLAFGLLSGDAGGPAPAGASSGPQQVGAAAIHACESQWVQGRRDHYASPEGPAARARGKDALGLALSGGGIRSATFSLGVLMALARRNILPQVDYLSTVSGGGYLGAFLTTFLSASAGTAPQAGAEKPLVGLKRDQLPFHRDRGEPEALRRLRHNSRYLQTGSPWSRAKVAFAQAYGLVLNLATLAVVVALVAGFDWLLNRLVGDYWLKIASACVLLMVVVAVLLPFGIVKISKIRAGADGLIAALAVAAIVLLSGAALQQVHEAMRHNAQEVGSWVLGGFFVLVLIIVVAGRFLGRTGLVWLAFGAVATVLLLLSGELVLYTLIEEGQWWVVVAVTVAALVTFFGVDVNWSSLHRHYRDRLAAAFLIVRRADGAIAGIPPRALSAVLSDPHASLPYPLVNAALNVPATQNPVMQGRLADFFLFSPFCCGSRLTGYYATTDWEIADPNLNVATVMAISGAAASPQMGLKTSPVLGFWMALLNVRLGYWLPRPATTPASRASGAYLLKEMFGRMDEKGGRLFVSDGGHIENLGVYELLRRRCKFIIAVDGEQDPRMTFHAITNLQRLVYIDFGIEIDVSLDDLRLGRAGLSRSHFIFCRIRYPLDGTRGTGDWQFGYLLYMKLSLTGNESEYLKRYKLDEPDFPHHSTANQFFTEQQFEAYRALGEHIGDKLFLEAIVGDIAQTQHVNVAAWFAELAQSLLQPLAPRAPAAGSGEGAPP